MYCLNLCWFQVLYIYDRYNRELKRDNLVDFDDLIVRAIDLLKIPSVKETIQNEIKHNGNSNGADDQKAFLNV